MTNRFLFLLILLTSFFFATTLLLGRIDQDFFTFYYIGKGILHGGNMYEDFADNKGPVYYVISAVTYAVFRDNYSLAIIVLSTFLDAIAIYALMKLLQDIYNFPLRKTWQATTLIILSVSFYKSFSIGSYLGGIYATTAEMALLSLALWAQNSKRNTYAGVLFALSVFTRPSAIFFLPCFIVQAVKNRRRFLMIKPFILASGITSLGIVIPFLLDGSLTDLIYNVITFNISGYIVDESTRWITLVYVIVSETRISFTLVYTAAILIFILIQKKQPLKYFFLVLLICSLIATFPKGIFSFHHFLQFMPIAFLLFGYAIRHLPRQMTYVILTFITLFTLSNYVLFLSAEIRENKVYTPVSADAANKKYLLVYPFYPEYYFAFNKFAPDRYFQGFFLNKGYSRLAEKDISRHKSLDKNRLRETLFVILKVKDMRYESDYIRIFAKKFHLKKLKTYTSDFNVIEIYESRL